MAPIEKTKPLLSTLLSCFLFTLMFCFHFVIIFFINCNIFPAVISFPAGLLQFARYCKIVRNENWMFKWKLFYVHVNGYLWWFIGAAPLAPAYRVISALNCCHFYRQSAFLQYLLCKRTQPHTRLRNRQTTNRNEKYWCDSFYKVSTECFLLDDKALLNVIDNKAAWVTDWVS